MPLPPSALRLRWRAGISLARDRSLSIEWKSPANVLRHAHSVPLADPPALRRWNLQWRHRSRKVSDRALVYASDPTHGHLLIYILKEPDAHMVPRMATDDHRVLMLKTSSHR